MAKPIYRLELSLSKKVSGTESIFSGNMVRIMGMYFTWFNCNSLAAQQCNQRDARAARPCVEQNSVLPSRALSQTLAGGLFRYNVRAERLFSR